LKSRKVKYQSYGTDRGFGETDRGNCFVNSKCVGVSKCCCIELGGEGVLEENIFYHFLKNKMSTTL
jgi:hypothetical protein